MHPNLEHAKRLNALHVAATLHLSRVDRNLNTFSLILFNNESLTNLHYD